MTDTLVTLDLSALLRGGGPEAVGLRRITTAVGRLRDIHERVTGQLPFSLDVDAAALQQVADAMRARSERLVIAGQPGGLRAVKALVGSSPNIQYVGCPAEAIVPEEGVLLLLEGPPWADRYAEAFAASGKAVAVAGREPDDPPDGWWFADPSPGDGRMGALNPGVLVAGAWAGLPVEAVLSGAREMAARCQRPVFFDNPGASWGSCIGLGLRPPDPGTARSQFLHLVADPGLAPLADYAVHSAMAVLSDGTTGAGVYTPVSAGGRWAMMGDEEELAGIAAARDRMVTLWTRRGGTDGAWVEAVKEHCQQAHQPAVGLRLLGDGPEVKGATLYLLQHAICVAAAWIGVDPRVSPGRDGWRRLLVRRTGPQDEGATSG